MSDATVNGVGKSDAMIPFNFEKRAVRALLIEGKPWWVAADACRVLEHSNPRMALKRLDSDQKGGTKVYTLGGEQTVNVVSLSGLFTLIARSNVPAAKRFLRWVTDEVLPALLRDGHYSLPGADQDELGAKRRYFAALPEGHRALAEVRAAAVDAVEARIAHGARVGAALDAVAAETGIKIRTLYTLRGKVWMVPRRDWPAALAPRWSGPRRMLAECHPAALARLMDLAGAGLRLSVAIAQVRAEARSEDWHPIPCDRTLRRAVGREQAGTLIESAA